MAIITTQQMYDEWKKIADRIGEISASPTSNTVQDRLKTLAGYLDGVEAALGATTDAAATGNGSLIAILKQVRAILTDTWTDAANALGAINRNSSGTEIFTAATPGQVRAVGSSSIAVGKKTVGTTQVALYAGAGNLANRRRVHLRVVGDDTVYVDLTGVTTSTGYPILPGEEKVFEIDAAVTLYGISASNQTVHIIEEA